MFRHPQEACPDVPDLIFDPAADALAVPADTRPERVALRVLQAGVLAVVIAAVTWKQFELDRFFVPKELILHIVALTTLLLTRRKLRASALTWIDALLLAFLLLGVVSALFAGNPWLGVRALTLTASSVALFWSARAVARAGYAVPLLDAIALAVIAGATTSLLQTYGVRTELFSINRAPGGTLGNRNFVAHLAAFGFPIVLLAALRARRHIVSVLWGAGVAVIVATLILTRSRAAWLAFAAALFVLVAMLLLSRTIRGTARVWIRLGIVTALTAAAIAAALLVPNRLRWNSDNPYLDSMRDVANFQEGSGRGRMIQYRQSLRMTMSHPLLGVGPGNWSVDYPRHAADNDPSLNNAEPGTTANPWPSSDWVALAAERGPAAAVILLVVFAGLSLAALRALVQATDIDRALTATATLATIAGIIVTGAFDAVLLLALPSFVCWAALGAMWTPPARDPAPRELKLRRPALAFLSLLALLGVLRSTSQLAGMGFYSAHSTVKAARLAARIDPGNYRAHLRLARSGRNRAERCEHALAARRLLPRASAARGLSRGCRPD
jgi:O-antigen ligase